MPASMIVEPVIMQARTPAPTFIPDVVPTGTAAAGHRSPTAVGHARYQQRLRFRRRRHRPKPSIAAAWPIPNQASFYHAAGALHQNRKGGRDPRQDGAQDQCLGLWPRRHGHARDPGYAPIQPDGSVQIQVPANVPFTIDMLDANARRITAQHTSWLQLMPGETKSCNGCHTRSTDRPDVAWPFGLDRCRSIRVRRRRAAHFRAPIPQLFANAGDTMAQTLARISCDDRHALTCPARRS